MSSHVPTARPGADLSLLQRPWRKDEQHQQDPHGYRLLSVFAHGHLPWQTMRCTDTSAEADCAKVRIQQIPEDGPPRAARLSTGRCGVRDMVCGFGAARRQRIPRARHDYIATASADSRQQRCCAWPLSLAFLRMCGYSACTSSPSVGLICNPIPTTSISKRTRRTTSR